MLTALSVWLCLITGVVNWTIIVNTTIHDDGICCENNETQCTYGSVSTALRCLKNNTVITIVSNRNMLNNVTTMGSGNLSNITITGNGATIMCNNTGGVYCESCSDVTIMGIVWYQCGFTNKSYSRISALHFKYASNVIIQNCSFQNSSGCPVYLENTSGKLLVDSCKFSANHVYDPKSPYECAGLYIKHHVELKFSVNASIFDYNGCRILNHAATICAIKIRPSFGLSSKVMFIFENTQFLHNTGGLYMHTNAPNTAIQLINVTFYNSSKLGAHIRMAKTYLDNETNLTLTVLSSVFESNVNALRFEISDNSRRIQQKVTIGNSSFISNTAIDNLGAVSTNIISSSGNLDLYIYISNSTFCSNLNGAINIYTIPRSTIKFTDVKIFNTSADDGSDASVSTVTIVYNDHYGFVDITFERVHFISNSNLNYNGRVLYVSEGNEMSDHFGVEVMISECSFINNTAFDHVVALLMPINCVFLPFCNDKIQISNCSFYNNNGGSSITYIKAGHDTVHRSRSVKIQNSIFSDNIGTALYCVSSYVNFAKDVLFANNKVTSGAAIQCNEACQLQFDSSANITFINNSAILKGGAIYVDLDSKFCNKINTFSSESYYANFTNNFAGMSGDFVYFSIPKLCHVHTTNISDKYSLLYVPGSFNYSDKKGFPIATSPDYIELYSSATTAISRDYGANNYVIEDPKMLGESIKFTASLYDYLNNTSPEVVVFLVYCVTCREEYELPKHHISVGNESLQEIKVLSTTGQDVSNKANVSILITFSAVISPVYKRMDVNLSISLSQCRSGYLFNISQCICYPYHDIVRCYTDYAEIKIGYWIGVLPTKCVTAYRTSNFTKCTSATICPNRYCNFGKHVETSPGYIKLPDILDDQCNSHRTGVACGECKPGYTLAYDSPDCINTDKCTAGMTILVIVLTILYWIAIVAAVFGLMYFQFQISSGYAYGIIYFYSIVNTLLTNTLYVSKAALQLITVVSSFAKLTPKIFGELCLVKGLSGIDQQFIYYCHALAVSLILLIIVLVTRYSPRLAAFVSRCIIRVICLLLLLSYTCLASASLQLLRPLTFNDVDEVCTYSSPDIKYFTGRHLAYAVVAILCEVIIVIGLPVFLLLEPFLSQRVNFVRIKPLLDQFQGCYKDNYRWFAAYYLICRQVIIVIVYVVNQNYYMMLYLLQTACLIISMIHIWAQPYENDFLNTWDAIVLLVAVLIVNLNTFTFLSSATTELAVILVLFPLFLCFIIAIRKLIRYYVMHQKTSHACNHIEENDQGMLRDDIQLRNVGPADERRHTNYNTFQESLLNYI